MRSESPLQTFHRIHSIWDVLDVKTRRSFKILTIASASVNILDLCGIFLFATFSSGILNLIQQNGSSTRFEILVEKFSRVNINGDSILAVVAALMLISFISKSLLSALLNKRILFFLASNETSFASKVILKSINKEAEVFNRESPEKLHFASGVSVSRMFNGVLYPLSQITIDSTLLLLVLIVLIFTSPTSTLLAVGIMVLAMLRISKRVHSLTRNSARAVVENSVTAQEATRELFEGYREIATKPYADLITCKFDKSRERYSWNQAQILWLQQVPRFSLEVIVIISAGLLSVVEWLLNDSRTALVKLSIFIVTVFRILPAIQRLQSSVLAINSGLIAADPALKVLKDESLIINSPAYEYLKSSQSYPSLLLEIKDATYKFQGSKNYLFNKLNAVIELEGIIGLTGSSGSGKSTLVDCISGIRRLNEGEIVFYTSEEKQVLPTVAYVPQKPFIVNESVLSNISLRKSISESEVMFINDLFKFFFRDISEDDSDLHLNLNTTLKGYNSLSGGQLQRIAVIRALVSKANIVIFDESFTGIGLEKSKKILNYLRGKFQNTIFIIISHSDLLLGECDAVLRLGDNQILPTSN